MTVDLRHGNCLDILPTLPDCSVDSIVTDPPYELGFMGKKWDNSGIAYNVTLWQECLRVLKPGGHLLAFGGTRTYHRMACAIEDAGFEIRDSIHWLYGSGFPKSLDVSKAIDKRGGNVAGFEQFRDAVKEAMELNGVSRSALTKALGNHMLSHYLTAGSQPAVPNARDYRIIRDTVGLGNYWDDLFLDEAEREIIGSKQAGMGSGSTFGMLQAEGRNSEADHEVDITAPATEQAKQWAGWGTALKPAHEPIVVARKPLVGTVASNVLEFGTGAINIDASRISGAPWTPVAPNAGGRSGGVMGKHTEHPGGEPHSAGRWPANVILGHTEDCQQVGTKDDVFGGGAKATSGFVNGYDHDGFVGQSVTLPVWECVPGCPVALLDEQSEGVSRFFYCAKPSRRERNAGLDGLQERPPAFGGTHGDGLGRGISHTRQDVLRANHHPTVKPLALMRYLVRLVTPPDGTVLEPFAGSGTTLMACVLENFNAIGIEMTDEYLPIIEGRIAWAEQEASKESPQQELQL